MGGYPTRSEKLQDLKTDVALFSETQLKPHMKFYIPNYDFYRADHQDGHRGGTAVSLTHAQTYLLSYQ
jgi:hypothetical protein